MPQIVGSKPFNPAAFVKAYHADSSGRVASTFPYSRGGKTKYSGFSSPHKNWIHSNIFDN